MPLFPLIGYSQAELRAEHQRGAHEEQSRCRQTLYETLQQMAPAVASRLAQHYQLSIPMLIQLVIEAVSGEASQRRQIPPHGEAETQRLQTKVSELEKSLAEIRSAKLYEQIRALIVERNALQNQVSQLQSENDRSKHEYSAKVEKLQEEVHRLDELIVKYEHRSRPQNTKH